MTGHVLLDVPFERGRQCSSHTTWLELGEICNYDYAYR
jgi:hypothetical protein